MRSAARAFAWEFRWRHQWGFVAIVAYFVVLAVVKLLVIAGQPIRLDTPESFAFVVVVPMTATFTYFLAVFSFGLSGDLAARQSMYPARMFTLPVTTSELALWPMVHGSVAIMLLWLATRAFALWPSGATVPLIWPALLAAVLLTWTQALTWMPYGLRWIRVIVAVVWLAAIDTIVLLALYFKAHELVMLALLAPQLPLAYATARYAIARARRGDTPDWHARRDVVAAELGIARHFESAASAQAWYEWHRQGRSLPAMVGILLPCELALLFAARDAPAVVYFTLVATLLTPVGMAAFAAATIRAPGLTPFDATRPVASNALIAARLRASIRSTLAAWLLVIIAIPLALELSGTVGIVTDRAHRMASVMGTPRLVVLVLVGLALLMTSTWKQLVQSMYIELTGREALVKGSVFVTLSLIALIGPATQWIADHRAAQVVLWNSVPALLGALVALKMAIAAWVVVRLQERRVLGDRALVIGAACWCATVLALYAVLAWLLNTPFLPRYLVGLAAILFVPLARVSAAPLALASNRHR